MRLKIPKATRDPSTAEESNEDRCCGMSIGFGLCCQFGADLVIQDSMSHNHAP